MRTIAASLAVWLAAGTVGNAVAAPEATGSAKAASSAPVKPTPDSRALRNQRMRKCKEMQGGEKTACQKDARTVAKKEAHEDAKVPGK